MHFFEQKKLPNVAPIWNCRENDVSEQLAKLERYFDKRLVTKLVRDRKMAPRHLGERQLADSLSADTDWWK